MTVDSHFNHQPWENDESARKQKMDFACVFQGQAGLVGDVAGLGLGRSSNVVSLRSNNYPQSAPNKSLAVIN